jgi:hypothetical protein
MTTARRIINWTYAQDGPIELTIYWHNDLVDRLSGEDAETILTMIRAGAGADEVEDRIERMRKEENVK